MKYVYKCECGFVITFETDTKPPKTLKCKQCKQKIKTKNSVGR